jgi:hypothetical protein
VGFPCCKCDDNLILADEMFGLRCVTLLLARCAARTRLTGGPATPHPQAGPPHGSHCSNDYFEFVGSFEETMQEYRAYTLDGEGHISGYDH